MDAVGQAADRIVAAVRRSEGRGRIGLPPWQCREGASRYPAPVRRAAFDLAVADGRLVVDERGARIRR